MLDRDSEGVLLNLDSRLSKVQTEGPVYDMPVVLFCFVFPPLLQIKANQPFKQSRKSETND